MRASADPTCAFSALRRWSITAWRSIAAGVGSAAVGAPVVGAVVAADELACASGSCELAQATLAPKTPAAAGIIASAVTRRRSARASVIGRLLRLARRGVVVPVLTRDRRGRRRLGSGCRGPVRRGCSALSLEGRVRRCGGTGCARRHGLLELTDL